MRKTQKIIPLQKELRKIVLLQRWCYMFALMALIVEFFCLKLSFVSSAFYVLFFIILQRLHEKTLRHLNYTYWTFSGVIILYLVLKVLFLATGKEMVLIGSFFGWGLVSIYSLVLLMLLIACYLLFSPLYYPLVRWWEYDFRYRCDLKIQADWGKDGKESVPGRLTDLRRGAGCVVLFEDLAIGDSLTIKVMHDHYEICLKGKIMSKREACIGRGIAYGVKFEFKDRKEKKIYAQLSKYWSAFSKDKERQKFSQSLDSE